LNQRNLTNKNPHNDRGSQTIQSEIAEEGRYSIADKIELNKRESNNSNEGGPDQQSGFFNRVKNLFRRNTSLQNNGN